MSMELIAVVTAKVLSREESVTWVQGVRGNRNGLRQFRLIHRKCRGMGRYGMVAGRKKD